MFQVPAWIPPTPERWRSPWAGYAVLRDHDPVHHVEAGDYWVLSRFADVAAAARDPATFSSARGLTFDYGEIEKIGFAASSLPIVMLDPPDHTEIRRLVSRGFTPRQVQELEPMIRTFVRDRLAVLREAGSGDIVASLFKPLPTMIVAHYLGVPEQDRDRFDGWTHAIVAANALGDPLGASQAVLELSAYFAEVIERRKADPGDDTITHLINRLEDGSVDGDADLLRVLGFAFTMVTGGNDTTTGMLGTSAQLLTERPAQRRLLIDDPSLIGDAVEELLRLSTPVQGLARTVTRDVSLRDKVIPEGRKVMLLYGAANRDPREFGPDADELDVQRRPQQILSFSHGPHHCLGAAAARLAAQVALEELLVTCPDFTVDADAGRFAPGHFVRRYESLPFTVDGLA